MATAAMGEQAAAATPQAGNAQGPILVDTQHDDMVHDAQLDYYGCKLATSSSDRTVKIYDVSGSQYTHTATLQGHEGPVWQVSWAHPKFGVILASCSFDGSVLIHRETRPQEWSQLHAARNLHESSVNGLAFCPHEFGLVVAAASSDGRVSLLTHHEDDITWGVEYIRDNALGVNAVSWAPFCAASSSEQPPQPRLVTGGCDNRIRFWTKSAATGQWEEEKMSSSSSTSEEQQLSHTDWVRDVAWAPSIVPNTHIVASCSEDRSVIIWTQTDGGAWKPTLLHTFAAPVWRLSWSVTGNVLAVSSGDRDVTLWKAGPDGVWTQMSSSDELAGAAQQAQTQQQPPPQG